MDKKQKIALVILTVILLVLPVIIYISRQRQEIRKKASGGCIITSIEIYPTGSWRQLTPTPPASNHYQVLNSTNNKFKFRWDCGTTAVYGFRVKNGNSYIETSCKSISSTGTQTACTTNYPYCPPTDAKEVICENLSNNQRYNISLEFFEVIPTNTTAPQK